MAMGTKYYMLQFWILVPKFYLSSLLAVCISSFFFAKKIVVVRMTVTVGHPTTGRWRLYLGLQFQHVVLKIIYKGYSTTSAVGKGALYCCSEIWQSR